MFFFLPLDCDPHRHPERLAAHAVAHAVALGLPAARAVVGFGRWGGDGPVQVVALDAEGATLATLSMDPGCSFRELVTWSGETLTADRVFDVPPEPGPTAAAALSAACALGWPHEYATGWIARRTAEGFEVRPVRSSGDGLASVAVARFDEELRLIEVISRTEPFVTPPSAMARHAASCLPRERVAR